MDDIFTKYLEITTQLLICGSIALIAEKVRPIQKISSILKGDMSTELGFCLFNAVISAKYFGFIVFTYMGFFAHEYLPRRIFNDQIQQLPIWLQVLVALLTIDLLTYVRHYFMHVFLWKFHAIHHAPKDINWITSYRLHPIEYFITISFQFLMLYMIGFDGKANGYAMIILIGFNIFTHLNMNLEFKGFMRYVISCPNYHRWHHATDKEAINKNFVAIFPFIDRIFGTYYFPEGKLPKTYGVYADNDSEKIPDGFLNQMVYPFRFIFRK